MCEALPRSPVLCEICNYIVTSVWCGGFWPSVWTMSCIIWLDKASNLILPERLPGVMLPYLEYAKVLFRGYFSVTSDFNTACYKINQRWYFCYMANFQNFIPSNSGHAIYWLYNFNLCTKFFSTLPTTDTQKILFLESVFTTLSEFTVCWYLSMHVACSVPLCSRHVCICVNPAVGKL